MEMRKSWFKSDPAGSCSGEKGHWLALFGLPKCDEMRTLGRLSVSETLQCLFSTTLQEAEEGQEVALLTASSPSQAGI